MSDLQNHPSDPSEQNSRSGYRAQALYPDDEISLVELWNVLARRWRVIAVTMILCVLTGLSYALLRSDTYVFTGIMEIGHYPVEGGQTLAPLDSVENSLSKLADGYVPDALRRFMDETPDQAALRVDVRNPRGSSLLIIEVKGARDEADALNRVLTSAARRLIEDHSFLLNVQRQQLEAVLEQARLILAEYEDERVFRIQEQQKLREVENGKLALRDLEQQQRVLVARIKRQDDIRRLLAQQVDEIRATIESATETRIAAVGDADSPTRAMTLLMIDSDIQQNRNRQALLDERLHFGLPNELDELQKRLDDVLRAQSDMKAEITARESALERFRIDWERIREGHRLTVRSLEARHAAARETRVVSPPARSLEPVGPSGPVVVVLSAIMGLMLGVFAAFFAEFLGNARARNP